MTKDSINQIYKFANLVLVKWSRVAGGAAGTKVLQRGDRELPRYEGFSEEIETSLRSQSLMAYSDIEESGDFRLLSKKTIPVVALYEPTESNGKLKSLSEEDYEKLTPGFKKLYRKSFAEPIVEVTELEFEVFQLDYELEEDVLMGARPLSELHEMLGYLHADELRAQYRNNYYNTDPRPKLYRVLPAELSGGDLIKIVGKLSKKIPSRGYGAYVRLHEVYNRAPILHILFFEEVYDGSLRKVLEKKRNGQPYADRRGRMVKNHPKRAGEAVVAPVHLDAWWRGVQGDSLPDASKLEVLTALTESLWKLEEN